MLLLMLSQQALVTVFWTSCALGPLALLLAIKNVLPTLSYPVRYIRQHIKKWQFLLDAPLQIQEGYENSHGNPFVVTTPDTSITFVASEKFIREVDKAPRDTLSLQAAAKMMLVPHYSMHKFHWSDRRGFDGTPLVRTLRSLLKHDLPSILRTSLSGNSAILDKFSSGGGQTSQLAATIRDMVAHTTAVALFGESTANNKQFMKAADDFTTNVIIIAEAVRLLPSFIGPTVARLLERRLDAQKTMFDILVPVAQQRIDEQEQAKSGQDVPEHEDCIQWVMQQSSRLQPWTAEVTTPWTAERIVHELMALWFGAMHSISMSITFALQDLCLHPEYVEPLRKEFEGSAYAAFQQSGNGLPLLDSFLKESSRVNPLDSMSTRRKALRRFEFSDGTQVQRGQWICTPLQAMLGDAQHWAKPLEFHGFRHVEPDILASLTGASAFESPEPEKAKPFTANRMKDPWQTWGTGRMSCPGRFYAAAALKQILGMLICRFDCELEDKTACRTFSWRTCNVPKAAGVFVLRPRKDITREDIQEKGSSLI